MGIFSDIFDPYGVRERGRRARSAEAREVSDTRMRETLDLRRREVAALEKIAARRDDDA